MKIKLPIKRLLGTSVLLAMMAVIICALVAFLVVQEVIPESSAEAIFRIAVLIAAFLVCCNTVKKAGKNRMQTSLIIGLLFMGICFLVGVILYPTDKMVFSVWPVLVAGVCVIAGFISSMKKERRR